MWITHAEGRDDDALTALRAAADAEDALGKHPVTPGGLMPAREQLGALFLELKRPREALDAYVAELKIYPARLRGLYGAGLAAEQVGDRDAARRYFSQLVAQGAKADAANPSIAHARGYLAAK